MSQVFTHRQTVLDEVQLPSSVFIIPPSLRAIIRAASIATLLIMAVNFIDAYYTLGYTLSDFFSELSVVFLLAIACIGTTPFAFGSNEAFGAVPEELVSNLELLTAIPGIRTLRRRQKKRGHTPPMVIFGNSKIAGFERVDALREAEVFRLTPARTTLRFFGAGIGLICVVFAFLLYWFLPPGLLTILLFRLFAVLALAIFGFTLIANFRCRLQKLVVGPGLVMLARLWPWGTVRSTREYPISVGTLIVVCGIRSDRCKTLTLLLIRPEFHDELCFRATPELSEHLFHSIISSRQVNSDVVRALVAG